MMIGTKRFFSYSQRTLEQSFGIGIASLPLPYRGLDNDCDRHQHQYNQKP
jgi:hypothetical protein